jgi:PadR family transcriptional regulator PadR
VTIADKFIPLRKGLLEYVVLQLTDRQQLYVAEMLQQLAGTEFATQEGTLYPLLSRLRREGLLDYDWRESDAGPPRKYYRLTDAGRAALAELRGYWQHLTHTLDTLGR